MNEQIVERIENVNKGSVPNGYLKIKACLFPSEWPFTELNRVLIERQERNLKGIYNKDNVLSVSGEHGIVNQISHLGRSYASENLENYLIVYKGDIVYTKSPLKANPYGIIKLNLEETGIVSPLYAVYSTKHIITGKYINYYFQIDSFLNNFLSPYIKRGPKNTMNVGNQDILHGNIPIPTLDEQEKIVLILDLIEKIINLKQQLIDQEEKRKKWVMKSLLQGKPTYKRTKIRDIAEVSTGATPSTKNPDYWGGDIRWMNSGELNLKRIYEVDGRITKKGLLNSGTKLLPEGCVLIGLAGQGKTRGTVAMNYIPLCTNQSVAAILPNENYNSEYLFWNLENRYSELRKLSSGDGARGGLNLELINSLTVYLPTKGEQASIALSLSSIDKKILLLKSELSFWLQKKQALMQLLLTVIVRVSI